MAADAFRIRSKRREFMKSGRAFLLHDRRQACSPPASPHSCREYSYRTGMNRGLFGVKHGESMFGEKRGQRQYGMIAQVFIIHDIILKADHHAEQMMHL